VENGLGTDIHAAPRLGHNFDYTASDPVSEFDQLKGQFLASLNHELRTPLSGVLGMTDLLAETRLDGDQREYVDTIRECASQLLEVLNALLDFSSLSAGHSQAQHSEFAFRALLESVAADAAVRAGAKGIRVTRLWDPGVPETIVGDERYLRQVLQHLMRNAVKFTSRGEIALTAEVRSGVSGRDIWIGVKDSGIGIPKDKLRLIFQAFRQLDSGLARSYAGLGLGLALADKLVRLMGGDISVESVVGQGTVFGIRVPLILPAGAVTHHGQTLKPARRPLILVVEDNQIAQRVVEHVLERADYDILFANDGEGGVRLAASTAVDLILMDLQMPGMDGFTASKAIRNIPGCQHVPILALTANYSDEHRAICKQIGMQGFLAKPIQRDELLQTIQAHLPAV
jgi:CheY-like chemotaxis protein/two-component sensor histidine kinase